MGRAHQFSGDSFLRRYIDFIFADKPYFAVYFKPYGIYCRALVLGEPFNLSRQHSKKPQESAWGFYIALNK